MSGKIKGKRPLLSGKSRLCVQPGLPVSAKSVQENNRFLVIAAVGGLVVEGQMFSRCRA